MLTRANAALALATSIRLRWLSDEADGHGWKLLARHHDAKITYVLVDEHGEMEFNTG
jgi:hypothetical protein